MLTCDMQYFTTFKFKSLDSYDFKSTLLSFFESDGDASKKLSELDWDTWFYSPGYPPKPDFDTSMVDKCYALADKWATRIKGAPTAMFEPSKSDIEDWSANQSVVFLEKLQSLPDQFTPEDVELMGSTYGYSSSKNVELVSRFYSIGLKAKDDKVFEPTAELLGKVGRMKFVRPLYRALNEVDRDLAVKTFKDNKDFYHPICRAMVEKDLLSEKK